MTEKEKKFFIEEHLNSINEHLYGNNEFLSGSGKVPVEDGYKHLKDWQKKSLNQKEAFGNQTNVKLKNNNHEK